MWGGGEEVCVQVCGLIECAHLHVSQLVFNIRFTSFISQCCAERICSYLQNVL